MALYPGQFHTFNTKSITKLKRTLIQTVKNKLVTKTFTKPRTWTNSLDKRNWTEEDEVTGGWRILHNEELHNLYSSPSITRVIKSRRMRWAGHTARMVERRNAYRILVGKPEDHWEDQDVDGWIYLWALC
jgi:hypothetical protein